MSCEFVYSCILSYLQTSLMLETHVCLHDEKQLILYQSYLYELELFLIHLGCCPISVLGAYVQFVCAEHQLAVVPADQ